MSARAAWRLEELGFTQVYDYVPSKIDWFANGLPREGKAAEIPWAGDLARDDAPTCGPLSGSATCASACSRAATTPASCGKVLFNEVEATHVEGSIFEFRFVEAGQPFVVEDSDGNVVVRNNGSVHGTYLFDTQGDDQPGGEWIADLDFRVAGPHSSLDKDPCDYAVELIG
jgi:hypothetical protein